MASGLCYALEVQLAFTTVLCSSCLLTMSFTEDFRSEVGILRLLHLVKFSISKIFIYIALLDNL